jgi:predicted  nucleic acid-binding Zn-ribbon protein
MNQPTREEFDELKEEQRQIKEEMRKLREQMTEPMKPINVNVASQDVISRLDGIQQYFSQELKTVSDTWLDTLQERYTEHKEDLKAMATKDDLEEMKREILDAIRHISSPGKN